MCHCTEIDLKALVRRWYDLAIGQSHRTPHRSGKLGNSARPVILGKHHFVWIVNEVLVGKHLEESKRFLLVRFDSIGRWLIGPTHDSVFSVALPEYLQILGVPRIV